MNKNKVLIAVVVLLVIILAVQTAFIVGRNSSGAAADSVDTQASAVVQESEQELVQEPEEETPKFVSKFSKYAISHFDYELTDDNFVYCLSDKTKKRITNTFTINKPYKRQYSCIQHRTYVQREIIYGKEIVLDHCMGMFLIFGWKDVDKFLKVDLNNMLCSYQQAQELYKTMADRFAKVENKQLKLTQSFANSLTSTESYLTKTSDMYLIETKRTSSISNWKYCVTKLVSENENQFTGDNYINGKVLSEYQAPFIKTVNRLATNQLQREVYFRDYNVINFSKHGLVVEVHDIGDDDECNYQFVYLPYEEFNKAWFYPEDVEALKRLRYVNLLW